MSVAKFLPEFAAAVSPSYVGGTSHDRGKRVAPPTATANVYGHLTDAILDRVAERTDVILGLRKVETA